jgi:hypothetical protein
MASSSSKRAKKADARKQLRLPSALAEWADGYAERKGTNFSALVVTHLLELKRQEDFELSTDAEQI